MHNIRIEVSNSHYSNIKNRDINRHRYTSIQNVICIKFIYVLVKDFHTIY